MPTWTRNKPPDYVPPSQADELAYDESGYWLVNRRLDTKGNPRIREELLVAVAAASPATIQTRYERRNGIPPNGGGGDPGPTPTLAAPVMSLLSAQGSPVHQMRVVMPAGVTPDDVVRVRFDDNPTFLNVANHLEEAEAPRITSSEVEFPIGPLPNGTWYIDCRIERGAEVSAWQDTPIALTVTGSSQINPPKNALPPTLSGTAERYQTLTASTGSWTNTPTGYEYVWYKDGVIIPNESGSSYVIKAGDISSMIKCIIRAFNSVGYSDPIETNAIGPILDTGGGTAMLRPDGSYILRPDNTKILRSV